MSDIKINTDHLCRHCKHFDYGRRWTLDEEGGVKDVVRDYVCKTDAGIDDPIDGHRLKYHRSPYVMRSIDGECGPEGRLWEFKEQPAWWERLWSLGNALMIIAFMLITFGYFLS